jgi:2',3'-cyclic-nucleotide 2'-phosphodiesterase (5'-nucleotidase family)
VFNEPKSHFVARMMTVRGYDAVGIGEMELGYGLDKLAADVEAYGLNLTSANVEARGEREPVAADNPSGKRGLKAAREHGTAFPPYLVGERDGVKFAFVSLVSPSTVVRSVGSEEEPGVEAISWAIGDPAAAAARIVPEAAERSDVVILLAHMDETEASALLSDLPQVDIAVLGHDTRTTGMGAEPPVVGNALVIKATSRGQNVGEMHFTTGSDGGVTLVSNRVHFLASSYEDDPEMLALLDGFDDENRKHQKLLYAKQQLEGSRHSEGRTYLGVGTCQTCHQKEFEVYKGTRHAQAYATLASQFMHRDTNCVGCHVTGYEEKGGFAGMRLRNAEIDLIDVQCEACHGPANLHKRDGSYLDIALESCAKCHTEHDDPDFDFERDWEKIKH